MPRGEGCKNCGVTTGWIHPEECIGCNGERSANHDYYPESYNYDGSPKQKIAHSAEVMPTNINKGQKQSIFRKFSKKVRNFLK